MKKLLFLNHLNKLDESSLAKQVLQIQDNLNLPGLVTECKKYILKYRLPNIMKIDMSKNEWKRKVKALITAENDHLQKAGKLRITEGRLW